MHEPQAPATGLVALLAALTAWVSPTLAAVFSPLFADLLVILLGSAGGAFLAVMDQETSHRDAARVALRGFVMACLFSGLVSVFIAELGPEYLRAHSYVVLLAIAGGIAWQQQRVVAVLVRALAAAKKGNG